MTATEPTVDLLDPDFQQCPHATFARLRHERPVHHVASMDLWYVTSRALVVEALRRPDLFSSRFGGVQAPPSPTAAERVAEIMDRGTPRMDTLITADPPAHTYYRRLARRALGRRDVARLEPQITELADRLLDDIVDAGPVDLVGGLSAPLTLTVIARLIGVPESRQEDFRRWSDAFTSVVGTRLDDATQIRAAEQLVELQLFLADQLEQRRADPRDDLLTALAGAHAESDGVPVDEPLSVAACVNVLLQLLVAGNETTTKLISSAVHRLATEPRWWDWLRADPAGRAPALVEESLRSATPVLGMFRIVARDTELGGVPLPAGARVLLSYGSASRDESTFTDPDTFDPTRPNAAEHLAFGHGVHHCIGATPARLEARVALTRIGQRVGTIELADPDPRYRASFMVRGFDRLDVRMTGA